MTKDGKGEVVGGITLMLKGGNATEVIKNVKERDGKDFGYFLDTKKIKNKYKWKNKTSIEQGLFQTISWIKDNLNKHFINALSYIQTYYDY